MLSRWRLLALPLVIAGALTVAVSPAAAAAESAIKDDIALTVRRDGVIHARETIDYDFGAGSDRGIERQFVTRIRVDDTRDRIFKIQSVRASSHDGGPTAVTMSGDDSRTIVTVGAGQPVSGRHRVVLEYDVLGALAPLGSGQELRWTATGGWRVPVAEADVAIDAGAVVRNLNCFSGELTSAVGCTQFFTNHTHTQSRFVQQNMLPGEYLTVVVGYPAGSTKVAPMYERRRTLATAFKVNGITGGALLGLLVLLLGGLALLYRTRGRDARIVHERAAEGDHAPIGDGRGFDPPDGVRPGQVGTLIDEQADVIDVTATIVDLAVRGYLLIEELPQETYGRLDWRLRRLDKPVADLHRYERLLYNALFDGRGSVQLSDLGGTFAQDLAAVRGALYDDVVQRGWFARRPDSVRTRWATAGMILTGAGVVGTIVLALWTNLALIGLAVVIAGAALAIGGQYMPAKTAHGATVLAHTLGFRAYLYRGEVPEEVPEEQRIALFSRYLPYAIVFDAIQRWAKTVADVDTSERADTLYWYEGPAEWNLSKFAESMRIFTLATSGAVSATRQFRSLT